VHECSALQFNDAVSYDLRVNRSGPRAVLAVVLLTSAILRFSFLIPGTWQQPWTPHHFDEHVLPYEALALWEGVTPREVGWPASPLRLLLSAVYGVRFVLDQSTTGASNAEEAMATVSRWIGARVSDPAPLYFLGRIVSAAIGVVQVVLTMVAVRGWLGGGSQTMAIGGALAAIAPLAVTHSQLVLADVSGTFFATLVLALIPGATRHCRTPFWLGVATALATASKFHFGIWLVPAIAACWVPTTNASSDRRERFMATVVLLAAFGITLIALVPWLWTNPALGLKEFAGVVLVKAGSGAGGAAGFVGNAAAVLGGLGWLVLLGAVPGAVILIRRRGMLAGIVVATAVVAVAVLSASAIVFDRYGLVVLPGLLLMGTAGWTSVLGLHPRLDATMLTGFLLVAGLAQPIVAMDQFRHLNSYHVAHEWLMSRLPNGASVVIYAEDNQYLPRTAAVLAACADYVSSDGAYREKWKTNGVEVQPGSGTPMELAVLNDERFHAFWCARELMAPTPPSAFDVRRFHSGQRFQVMTPAALREEFEAGRVDSSRGFDAILVHWPLIRGVEPDVTFESTIGPPLQLYLRPGLLLRESIR
jgi:hypothetical protein